MTLMNKACWERGCPCYDARDGDEYVEVVEKKPPPQFPTMLRKMWSGTEVQEWINENWGKA